MNQINLWLSTCHCLREVDDALRLPTWLQRCKPIWISWLITSNTNCCWRALKNEKFFRRLSQFWNDLHRCCASANNADSLVCQFFHQALRTSARIGVVPTTGMKCTPLKRFNPGYSRKFCLMQNPTSNHNELGTKIVLTRCRHHPTTVIIIPLHPCNFGLKKRSPIQVKSFAKQLTIRKNFWRLCIFFSRHIASFFKKRQVHIRLNITGSIWITVPVPRAPEVAAFFHNSKIGDPRLCEIRRRNHSAKSTTNNDHVYFFRNRLTSKARLHVRITIKLFIVTREFFVLLDSI